MSERLVVFDFDETLSNSPHNDKGRLLRVKLHLTKEYINNKISVCILTYNSRLRVLQLLDMSESRYFRVLDEHDIRKRSIDVSEHTKAYTLARHYGTDYEVIVHDDQLYNLDMVHQGFPFTSIFHVYHVRWYCNWIVHYDIMVWDVFCTWYGMYCVASGMGCILHVT